MAVWGQLYVLTLEIYSGSAVGYDHKSQSQWLTLKDFQQRLVIGIIVPF